jgi:hypothetical protein
MALNHGSSPGGNPPPIITPPPMNPNPPLLPPAPKPDSQLVTLAKMVEASPKHLYGLLLDMLIAPLCDAISTTWVITCVLLAFIVGPLIAATVFFGGFTLMRVFGQLPNATGAISNALHRHASIIEQQPQVRQLPPPE